MPIIGQIINTNTYTTVTGPGTGNVYADVYITLVDAATGQPVNGNNATVNYQQNDNGTITAQQVVIAGQSQLIYSGIIQQYAPDSDGLQQVVYYRSYTVTSVNTSGAAAAPVNICDLKITAINVDKPESAPGANDAQITVSASSSYLPINYSINGVTFQFSGTFTNLSGGVKTVYLTDANPLGCTLNQQVSIPVLTDLLLNDPSKTIGANTSRWNAAFNPIVFTYQRQDFEITAASADSLTGNAALTVNANLTGVITGDMVYVSTNTYTGIFNVVSLATNQLVINAPYTANATGFININRLRPYYKLLTKITYQDKLTGTQNTITSTNRPDNAGLVRADLSNFLQSILRAKDESDFSQINFRDDNLSASYQIAYAQQWDDGTANGYTSSWTALPHPYYVVYAAKQLGDKYGGNLAAYVPFKTIAPGAQPAQWVTDFTQPAYSNGYPFDIGFIYGDDLAGLDLYVTATLLDINKNPLGNLGPVNLLNEDGSFLTNQDASKLVIRNSASGSAAVIEHIGLNRLLINNTFNDDVYYLLINIAYTNSGVPSTFNYSVTESASPFVDANLQIKENGVVRSDIYTTDTGSLNIQAGSTFSVEAYAQQTSAAAHPAITLTITKNGVTVFEQSTAATPGASLIYTGTADIGATYNIITTSGDGITVTSPINITDTTTVTSSVVKVMQDQLIRIDKSPDINSIYLRWIGLTGSWNYYRFIYNQEVSLDVQNATIIKNYVFDWENQDAIEEVIGKSAGQKIKVTAEDLSVADIKGLQSIKYSPKVQMLISKNPVKWQTIVLNTATFNEYETLNGTAPFSVTFNMPSINIQTQ